MSPPIVIIAPPPIVTTVDVTPDGLSWVVRLANPTAEDQWSDVQVAWRIEPAARGVVLECELLDASAPNVQTSTEDWRSMFVDTQVVPGNVIDARMWLGENIAFFVAAGEIRVLTGAAAPPADLDADGYVGPSDLATLLGAWGSTESKFDLDMSGEVGASDLAILLGAWKPAPTDS